MFIVRSYPLSHMHNCIKPLTFIHTEFFPTENEVEKVLKIKGTQLMETIHSMLNWRERNAYTFYASSTMYSLY